MLDDGEKLVPGFRQARALRVWTGVRPLFEDAKAAGTDSRDVTPRARVARPLASATASAVRDDHRRQAHDLPPDGRGDGERRLQAPRRDRPCTTTTERAARVGGRRDVPARRAAEAQGGEPHRRAADLRVRAGPAAEARGRRSSAAQPPTSTTSAGSSGLGMGPCQGGFCIYRADRDPARRSTASPPSRPTTRCCDFLQERWKGVWPVLYGDQLRQARLDDWIFQGVLDVEHLPVVEAEAVAS